MLLRTTILFTTLLILSSCEGYKCADGIVKDNISKIPLDSVYIKVVSGSKTMFTDTTGRFEICNNMGGCMFGCKEIIVEFSKSGYKTQALQNPDPDLTILLERQ